MAKSLPRKVKVGFRVAMASQPFQENTFLDFRDKFLLSLSHIHLQFDNQPKMTRAVVDEIKKMTTDVISDRKFCKAMACYVQEERSLLCRCVRLESSI